MQGTYFLTPFVFRVGSMLTPPFTDVTDDTGPIPLNNVAMNVLKKVLPPIHLLLREWILMMRGFRFLNGPIIIKMTLLKKKRMILVIRNLPTLMTGIKSLCRSIKKCYLKSFLYVPPITDSIALALTDMLKAANYLDIKPLLDTGCKTVANMIKGKSPEEIRKTFNITNDFT